MKWTILTFTLITLASCQNNDNPLDPTQVGFFPEDTGEVRKPTLFAETATAAGARADATLYRHHFDGGRLNSLGEQKLALMIKGNETPTALTIHLNLDAGAATSKVRQAAVIDFLKDQGLTEQQIEVVYGDNPATRSPAATHLQRMNKTETGSAESTGTAGANTAPQGAGPGGNDGGLFGQAGAK